MGPQKRVHPEKWRRRSQFEGSWSKIGGKMGVLMKKWVTKVRYHVHSVAWGIYTSTSMIIKLCIVDYNILKYSSIFFSDQISHLCSQKHAQLSRIQSDKAFFQKNYFFVFFIMFRQIRFNGKPIKACFWPVMICNTCRFCDGSENWDKGWKNQL